MGFQYGSGCGFVTVSACDKEVVNVQIQNSYRVQYFSSKTHEEI